MTTTPAAPLHLESLALPSPSQLNSSRSSSPPGDDSDARQITRSTSKDAGTSPPNISRPVPPSRRIAQRECVHCGVTFERMVKEIRRAEKLGKPMYCSKRCASLHMEMRPPVLQKHETAVAVTCAHCQHPLMLPGWDHAKKVRRGQVNFYCGPACVGASQQAMPTCERCGEPTGKRQRRYCLTCIPLRRAERQRRVLDKFCSGCGAKFKPRNTRMTYCSRGCANRAHSKRMVGKGNSRYKNGTSYALLFRSVRPLILGRDGGCVVCGTTRKLHVHHIDEDPTNNRPQNLVTLCHGHHMTHHKSNQTPWPWFADYAADATLSTTSKWKATTTSLLVKFSSTTAS